MVELFSASNFHQSLQVTKRIAAGAGSSLRGSASVRRFEFAFSMDDLGSSSVRPRGGMARAFPAADRSFDFKAVTFTPTVGVVDR